MIIFLISSTANAENILGQPTIVDGDTLRIENFRIRLHGIDAPEINQICKKNKKDYACGKEAKKALSSITRSQNELKCIPLSKDRYGRFVAKCFIETRDIGKLMVQLGWAVAYKRYSREYVKDEELARQRRIGLWNGSFQKPEKWRKNKNNP